MFSMEKQPVRQFISTDAIGRRVAGLGCAITDDHATAAELVVVCVLKGAFIFAADLVRHIGRPTRIEFLRASSYGSRRTSSGELSLGCGIDFEVAGSHVLVVEDIVDTGLTLSRIVEELRILSPASLKVCTLLDKPAARQLPVDIDYVGFTIPPLYVVGYGLDDAETHRELPFIGIPVN